MNETQRRIKAYKEALPGLRERVVAVALLLAMSLAMMTSASFAWLTISRRPEVTGVNTTIASNGNLEIALATGDGEKPEESKVGDSSATKGQSIAASNITWGNLINLGDPSYGLDNLTLRPAQLNNTALLTSPLYSAVFKSDGRVDKLTSSFSYTSWIPPEGDVEGYFGLSTDLGVRAISSVKSMVVGYAGAVRDLQDIASSANPVAAATFTGIIKDTAKMGVLAKVLGIHMTANLNTEDQYVNATITQEELETLISMYAALIKAHEEEADAIAQTLNLQLYVGNGGLTNYVPYKAENILAMSPTDSRIDQTTGDFVVPIAGGSKELRITDLKTFLKDYAMLKEDEATLWEIHAGGDYAWKRSGLRTVVNKLMNVDECLVKKRSESQFKTVKALMAEFSDNITAALGYRGAECDIVITNGVLYNFEQRLGTSIQVERMKVTAKMYVSSFGLGEQQADIYAYVTTSAEAPYHFNKDLAYSVSKEMDTGPSAGSGFDQEEGSTSGATVMAQDTYALAVDFWVRTNHASTYLILEGNVLTEDVEQYVTGKDANGTTVDIYTLARSETIPAETDADGNKVEGAKDQTITNNYDLYQGETTDEAGQKVSAWFDAKTHEEFPLRENETPVRKVEIIHVVVGYEGENRIWDTGDESDKQFIGTNATTQGAGSCYVYYADTPEDQARSLELLKAMKVAFVGADGALLATAEMDTEKYFAEGGRVIVPLKLNSESTLIGTTIDEEPVYGITQLEQNTPTRITAIVYLDGAQLTNQSVLAAADIQGKLNIQFGTSDPMTPIDHEPLENATRSISASVSEDEFNYDTHEGEMRTTVTVRVEGEQPTQMKAFFMRQINATQGSREKEMTFDYNEATGTWTSDYVFTSPGNYILRTVYLDGVEYDLGVGSENPEAARPRVTITGFTVKSLSCAQANTNRDISIMSASSTADVDLTLRFATDDASKLPKTVQGRFMRSDGTPVNVNFLYDTTTNLWSGSATFRSSGDYAFTYLIMDGEYVELPADMWLDATVSLGMRVAVYTTSPNNFTFVPEEMEANEKTLFMQVKIMNNEGAVIPGLTNTILTYRLGNSSIRTMDTNLVWNGVSGYYEGSLKTLEMDADGNAVPGGNHPGDYGVWNFAKVDIGGYNSITSASPAPSFSMMPPDPPSYHSYQQGNEIQYSPAGSGRAFMNVFINYSSATKVWAVVGTTDNTYEQLVEGDIQLNTIDAANQWFFTVPLRGSGATATQAGQWVIKELHIWNYVDSQGNNVEYPEVEEGKTPDLNTTHLVIDLKDENIITRVVQDMDVFFPDDGNLNKTLEGENFMHTYSFNGLNMYFRAAGSTESLTDMGIAVGDVQLVYNYDKTNMKAYGHYTTDSIGGVEGIFTLTFNAVDPVISGKQIGSSFTQAAAQDVTWAGDYVPAYLSYKVYDTSGNLLTQNPIVVPVDKLPANKLHVAVKSNAASVIVAAVTPEGKYGIDTSSEIKDTVTSTSRTEQHTNNCGEVETTTYYTHTWHNNAAHKGAYLDTGKTTTSWISSDKLTATVYFRCVHADDATYSGGTDTTSSSASNERLHYYYSDSVKGVPTVTLRLSGISGFTSATLNVSNTTHIYTGVTYSTSGLYGTWQSSGGGSTYSWTSEGDVTRTIGYVWGQKGRVTDSISATGKKTPAGTITADTLTVVYNGQTYTFYIPTVTIKNPY